MSEDKTDDFLETFLGGDSSEDKSARMIIRELLNAKEIDLKTHLSEKETLTFAKAEFYATEVGNKGFKSSEKLINCFSTSLMRKRLSFNRMSRPEFIEGVKPELQTQMQEDKNKVERMIR